MTDGPGIVYLVGAGPGDPGLMTIRSLDLIVAADVIVHDRLIPRDALAAARPDAEILYVGKEPGDGKRSPGGHRGAPDRPSPGGQDRPPIEGR